MFVKIGGIQGTGKTTITRLTVAKLQELGVEADIIHGAEIMSQIMGVTIEELRKMSDNLKIKAREEMFQQIYAEDRKNIGRIILRDAHFSFFDKTLNQFVIVPYRKEDRQQMKAMVVLDIPVEEVINRRKLEINQRNDRVLDVTIIEREREIELDTARKQAGQLGIPILIIDNFSQSAENTSKYLISCLRKERIIDPEILPKIGAERNT